MENNFKWYQLSDVLIASYSELDTILGKGDSEVNESNPLPSWSLLSSLHSYFLVFLYIKKTFLVIFITLCLFSPFHILTSLFLFPLPSSIPTL